MKYILIVAILFSSNIAFSQKNTSTTKEDDAYGADVKDVKNLNIQKYADQLLPETDAEFVERTKWFTDAKFGMFIHFGLYSHLEGEYNGEISKKYAEWIQADLNIPKEDYMKLIDVWNPKKFNAKKIVKAAKSANMKYLVVTTKHHEGFCLWPSEYTDFDIENSPMKGRDLLRELSDECKKQGIVFGTYYSIIDWNHPSQYVHPEAKTRTERHGQISMHPERKEEYITYMKNQIKELVENYDSKILWFDGDWVKWWTMDTGIDLYNYIRSLDPEIIINNRCAVRSKFKLDFGTPEQRHHESEKDYLWEACYTMNHSWGFKKSDTGWKSSQEVYNKLIDINSQGGNFLLNIGPDKNGEIPEASVKILKEVGEMINNDK